MRAVPICSKEGCSNRVSKIGASCLDCQDEETKFDIASYGINHPTNQAVSISKKYPKYYKSVSHLDEIDVYQVHNLFNIQDPSGAIQHASKKLLLSGVRTGNKTQYKDIQEARDTLNRWLEMNETLKE